MDAGPLYAYIDADDQHHSASLELLESYPGPLIVPVLVVTEVSYLVATRLGVEPEVRFLGDLAVGNFNTEPVRPGDWVPSVQLGDLPWGRSMPR